MELTLKDGQRIECRPEQADALAAAENLADAVAIMERWENAVCDFCSATPVEWSYPATTFLSDQFSEWGSAGSWAACQPCHDLIEADDYDALGSRSIEKYEIPLECRWEVRKSLLRLHSQFRAARTGDAVKVEVQA